MVVVFTSALPLERSVPQFPLWSVTHKVFCGTKVENKVSYIFYYDLVNMGSQPGIYLFINIITTFWQNSKMGIKNAFKNA